MGFREWVPPHSEPSLPISAIFHSAGAETAQDDKHSEHILFIQSFIGNKTYGGHNIHDRDALVIRGKIKNLLFFKDCGTINLTLD